MSQKTHWSPSMTDAADRRPDRTSVNTGCLAPSAMCCDIIGLVCAAPALCICSACTGGPYNNDIPPPPTSNPRKWEHWYRSAIHSPHGGSLLQLLATHAAYWRFPIVERRSSQDSLHRVQVAPRNTCGRYCFVPMVEMSDPHFRIRKDEDGTRSVRLTTNCCGISSNLSGSSLNDVWRISADGRIIRSMKTRSHCVCADSMCVLGVATGPAFFIAVEDDDLPTAPQILTALRG